MKNNLLTKILAVLGTALVWFPILAPLILAVIVSPGAGQLMLDYLMPAELFPVGLVGALLLLWAAFRAHARRGMIGWGLLTAILLLVGGQAIAVVTGLASGETEPTTLLVAIVGGTLAIYALALVEIGVGGILLARDVFKSPAAA